MALELDNTSLSKKTETQSLDLLSGADDSIFVKAGETFAGNITHFIVNTAGTVTEILANDAAGTDITAGGLAQGFKNIDGATLSVGTKITSGKYGKGANIKSVTTGTATIVVYYKYTKA